MTAALRTQRAKRLIAACAMLAWSSAGFCQSTIAPNTIGLHLASAHSASGFNNRNPGVYLRWADSTGTGWVAGTYYNSERAQSGYAAYAWSTRMGSSPFSAAITAGAVSGYSAHCVTPLLVPSLALHTGHAATRLTYVPKAEKRGAHALHLSVEWSL